MFILLEIKFCIIWAINPALAFLAIQTDFCCFGITLIQYRDTLDFLIKLLIQRHYRFRLYKTFWESGTGVRSISPASSG